MHPKNSPHMCGLARTVCMSQHSLHSLKMGNDAQNSKQLHADVSAHADQVTLVQLLDNNSQPSASFGMA